MAVTVARLEAILSANTRDFDRAMNRSETRMHKVGKVAGLAGIAIAGGLAVGLEKSLHAAVDDEAANNRLAQSFRNAHVKLAPYVQAIKDAEAAGRKLGFTDEQTKVALGSLITATGNYAKAQKDLSVAYDIARFKNVSLTDASKMLTMAMTGSQRAAKQLGITVIPLTTNMDALGKNASAAEKAQAKLLDKMATGDAVIKAVNQHVHGQAQAYSETAAGGMAQYHAQMEHLQVTIGTKLLPAFVSIINHLNRFIEWVQRTTVAVRVWRDSVIQHVQDVYNGFTRFLQFVEKIPGRIGKAITDGAGALKKSITDLFDKVIGWVKGALGIKSPSSVFYDIGVNMIKGLINGVGSMAGALKKYVLGLVTSHIPDIPFTGGHGGGKGAGKHASPGEAQGIARTLMVSYGWGQDQWRSLRDLWMGESGWRWNAENASSGAYGIPQSLPASKMASAGADWHDNAATQIAWGLNYIKSRYGSPNSAYSSWQSRSPHWYDTGGWLPPGLSLAMNNTGRPERVLGPGEGMGPINLYVDGQKLFSWFQGAERKHNRRNSR